MRHVFCRDLLWGYDERVLKQYVGVRTYIRPYVHIHTYLPPMTTNTLTCTYHNLAVEEMRAYMAYRAVPKNTS